jgi:hypothetical protein
MKTFLQNVVLFNDEIDKLEPKFQIEVNELRKSVNSEAWQLHEVCEIVERETNGNELRFIETWTVGLREAITNLYQHIF